MGTFVKWAKQLSVVTGMTVGVVVGLIYQTAWWVISLVSVLAWLVIEGFLKISPGSRPKLRCSPRSPTRDMSGADAGSPVDGAPQLPGHLFDTLV